MPEEKNLPALVLGTLGQPPADLREKLRDLPAPFMQLACRPDLPWGLGDDVYNAENNPRGRDLKTIRVGRSSWFFKGPSGETYDTIRDAFIGERFNHGGHVCGCIRMPSVMAATAMATIDCEAQLEMMREVLRRVLLDMPEIDLDALAADLFAGHRPMMEHYLWWLEGEALIGHPDHQQLDQLMLTREGCSALIMLEMTKPGSNHDLSPAAAHEMRKERRKVEAEAVRLEDRPGE